MKNFFKIVWDMLTFGWHNKKHIPTGRTNPDIKISCDSEALKASIEKMIKAFDKNLGNSIAQQINQLNNTLKIITEHLKDEELSPVISPEGNSYTEDVREKIKKIINDIHLLNLVSVKSDLTHNS